LSDLFAPTGLEISIEPDCLKTSRMRGNESPTTRISTWKVRRTPKKKVYLKAEDMTQENVIVGIELVKQLQGEVLNSVTLHRGNNILAQLYDWLCRYEAALVKAQKQMVDLERNSLAEIING